MAWYERPGNCASLLYTAQVGDLLTLSQSGPGLVVTGESNPDSSLAHAEYEGLLKETWSAICKPELNPHLYDPEYIAQTDAQELVF